MGERAAKGCTEVARTRTSTSSSPGTGLSMSWSRSTSGEPYRSLIEGGKLAPVIDRTYPFAELPGALAYQEEGHALGKVVITV